MDSITQFTLGAAVGEAIGGKKLGNKAMLWGGLAGTIPDFDVLANFFMNELDAMAAHRGITHSLFFAFLAPLPIVYLIRRFSKKTPLSFKEWYLLFFLGFFTHIFIDVCTTYGTQVFQPFSNYRLTFNNIAVADPFYTIPFLIFVVIAAFFKRSNSWRSKLNWAGIVVSSLYLVFTFYNKNRATKAFKDRLDHAQIAYTRVSANPTILNNILWHAVAETPTGYVESYYSFLDKIPPFEQLQYFDKNWEYLNSCPDNDDIEMLKWFADGYYFIDSVGVDEYTFNDLRFGSFWSEDPNKEPVFIFNFILDECNVRSNQNRPEGDEAFKSFFDRVCGL